MSFFQSFFNQIIFDQYKRASAIQFDRFSLSYIVYASKEIIISAGAINSPQLLMLSGIGPADHLGSLGVSIYSIEISILFFSIRKIDYQKVLLIIKSSLNIKLN